MAVLTGRYSIFVSPELRSIHSLRRVVLTHFPFTECPLNRKHRIGVKIGSLLVKGVRDVGTEGVLREGGVAHVMAGPANIGVTVKRGVEHLVRGGCIDKRPTLRIVIVGNVHAIRFGRGYIRQG